MEIQVKLMGILKEKTPHGGKLELPEGATVADVLQLLDVPGERVHVFTVNGSFERDRTKPLQADDELCVIPPVGGG